MHHHPYLLKISSENISITYFCALYTVYYRTLFSSVTNTSSGKSSRSTSSSGKGRSKRKQTLEKIQQKSIINNTATSFDEDKPVYKEINRMLILSFYDILNHEQFHEKFNMVYFEHVAALTLINKTPIAQAQRIIHGVSKKAEELKKR